MAIPILATAFGIYIFGISAVLYLRPQIMFGKGGDWKEFGIGRGDSRTVVPFWLFAIFWAFISYGVALVIMSQFANIAIGVFPEQNLGPLSSIQQPTMSFTPPTPAQNSMQAPVQPSLPNTFMKPVSSSFGIPNNLPGYYVLQNPNTGLAPQYVYYGTEPPRLN